LDQYVFLYNLMFSLKESRSPDIEREDAVSGDNDEEGEKKTRKKIDIANPDIINDFFKTDED